MQCVGNGQTEAISWKKTWKMFRSGGKWEFKKGQTQEQSSPWTGRANTEWASRTYVKILTPINMKPPSLSQIKNVCFSPYVLSFFIEWNYTTVWKNLACLVQRNLFNASMLGHSEVSWWLDSRTSWNDFVSRNFYSWSLVFEVQVLTARMTTKGF